MKMRKKVHPENRCSATVFRVCDAVFIMKEIVTFCMKGCFTIQKNKKICSIIDLELEDPNAADYAEIPFENRVTYPLSSKLTVNLSKTENDTKSPYAQVEVTLMLNKTAEAYETVQPLLANYEPIIRSIVGEEISKYTTENLNGNKDFIQKTIRTRLSTEFGTSDLLIAVDLNWTYDSK